MKNFIIYTAHKITKQLSNTINHNRLKTSIEIEDDNLQVKIYGICSMPPYINASINDNTIFIYDIKTRIKGIGLGSILMNSLIDYAKDHNIHTINGYITHHDAEKTPWITDYYKKHGFTITPVNDPNMKYLIILDLIDKIG